MGEKIRKIFGWIGKKSIELLTFVVALVTLFTAMSANEIAQTASQTANGLTEVANEISQAANRQAEIANEMTRIELERVEFARPIIYEFIFENRDTSYKIFRDDALIGEIPAKELTINIIAGTPRSITMFQFDGDVIYYANTLQHSSYGTALPTIQTVIPAHPNPLILDDIFYDYMFLLIVPVEGNPALYMLCVEIDIDNGELLHTEIFDKYNLLELHLNAPISNPRRNLLEIYYELMRKLIELEML